MATSASAQSAVRAAFTHLVDYAGLFPPATLEMAPAVSEYLAARRGPYAWMLGRFIVPASRAGQLLSALPQAQPEPLPLSVIVDAGADPRTWLGNVQTVLERIRALESEPRVTVESLEIALPPLQSRRESYDAAIGQFDAARKQAGLQALPAFVELPRDGRWQDELEAALFAMRRHGIFAKLRCGGVVAQAFPSAGDVAAFICACAQNGVRFKATAGLHHPIRHRDAQTGAMMHGFLNVLAAAAFARGGTEPHDVLAIVSSEDPQQFQFTAEGLQWQSQTAGVEDARENAFVSYGSCSFAEPTGDLHAMGLI